MAVIGETVRKNLFPSTEAVGKKIRVGSLPFLVVGVLVAKGQSAALSEDQDDTIIAPLTTVQKKITGQPWLRFAMASTQSRSSSYVAQQQVQALLRDRHRIRAGQPDDFTVRNLADIADVASEASKVMTALLGSIGGVSLFVGGLGIMNIMLVSVTERTREIGIRIAIGATESDVQSQFLIEAVAISLLGGIIGILAGVSASFIISATAGWPIATEYYLHTRSFGGKGITLPLEHPIVIPIYEYYLHTRSFGGKGIRTPDLLIANETLYQLSYTPEVVFRLRSLRWRIRTQFQPESIHFAPCRFSVSPMSLDSRRKL